MPDGSVSLVLLAGGVGSRMKAGMPKQYLALMGKPIVQHSLDLFLGLPEVREVVVVCDPSWRDEIFGAYTGKVAFALPGAERQDSVRSGLAECSCGRDDLVAIHDSARPLVTPAECRAVFADAAEHGAAVLGVPSKATVKQEAADARGFVGCTLDRSMLWEVATPQVMRRGLLEDGFDKAAQDDLAVTDDVSLVEMLGAPVKLTLGEYTNIKVTTPEDMFIAERLLSGP